MITGVKVQAVSHFVRGVAAAGRGVEARKPEHGVVLWR
jgi:hypothetical protein